MMLVTGRDLNIEKGKLKRRLLSGAIEQKQQGVERYKCDWGISEVQFLALEDMDCYFINFAGCDESMFSLNPIQ